MFEYEQDIVEALLQENDQFKLLYQQHTDLKAKVREANQGTLPLDNYSLENLKKEKLLLKDKMASIVQSYRWAQARNKKSSLVA
ncbi:MAG: DUF465 domain-containing protein [Gammaproteobacteria bacterium]|jgi:hypothetical protein|nr:hypothetical protein [Gammaproteobacteria bacterium]MDP6095828.1 DUF465 domain-containing protein [Gammaproteobacteria bacterium]|tara:strand:+ start:751 stop:1002 length:252 start_codon:yes stop_codon:yes gene_type:complete